MDIQAQAQRALEQAEQSLRSLIHQGLEEQRYGEVATLAQLAQGIARLRGVSAAPQSRPKDGASVGAMDPPGRSTTVPNQQSSRGQPNPGSLGAKSYPRFEREAEVLIKVGWSKKNRTEYEHKAARENVEAFSRRLAELAGGGSVFTMDDILPMRIADKSDMPDYQAYLSLAWLRERGIVQKQGRDGYFVSDSMRLGNGFEEEWQTLPIRPGDETHE